MRFAVLVALVVACSDPPCGSTDLVASYTLTAPGIQVVVESDPLAIRVVDDQGTTVLATANGRDGYAPATWTSGVISTKAFPAPGYFSFQAVLDPWHDLELVGAVPKGDSAIELHLHDTSGGDECMTMSLALRDHALRVEASTSSNAETPRAWSTGFSSAGDEAFLGFGERFNRTNQRGVSVFSYAEEGGIGTGEGTVASPDNPYPSGEAMTGYPVPFFISTRGYGFWLDTTWRSQFELATEREDAWRVWHVGPSLAYEVFTPAHDGSDTRPWPYQLIDRFTETTGRPMTAPTWAYGPRRRINVGDMQGEVSELQAMRDLDLAITSLDDAVHFYPNGSHIGLESQLSAWTASAKALGYRVNGYYNSMINRAPESPLATRAAEGLANGYYLTRADGTFPDVYVLTGGKFVDLYVVDFTREGASAWYGQSFDWANALGYSGWMYDFGEYVQTDAVAANGMTGEELHNLYPVIYAKAAHEHMEATAHAGDWLAFMRSGYTGSSAFVPATWSGDPAASFEDSDGLPSMVRGGINAGLSGIPNWGGDIGGYHCIRDTSTAADGELLARWIEQGALTPIMMDQDSCVGGSENLKASIWSSTDAQDAWRTYARLHTRLAPYLVTLGKLAHETGAPIMRHAFLEHPDQIALASEDTAYYIGQALYVAPVLTRGARTRTVQLPPGTFLEWQPSGAATSTIAGGQSVTLDAPLAKLPMLLRAGYLLPLLDPTVDTLADESDASIVSAADVGDVYDVVALLVLGQSAALTLADGTVLSAAFTSALASPSLPMAASDGELATCNGCYRRTTVSATIERIQISAPAGPIVAGGLTVGAQGSRRIRWDLYLATP